MSSATRLVLGLVVVVGCLGVGAVVSAQHRQQLVDSANRAADEQLELAWSKAAESVRGLPAAMGERAASVARLQNISALLRDTTSQSDLEELAKNFADFRANEPWFTGPVAGATSALFIGTSLVSTSEPSLTAESLELISQAQGAGKASALVVVGGSPWLVGVARTEVQNRSGDSGFIALGRRLVAEDLSAQATGSALQLVSGGDEKSAIGVGDVDGLVRLARRRISMKRDESHCCLSRELAPGLELALFKNPEPLLAAAEVEATRDQWPRLGIAGALGLLGLIALFLSGRRATKADDERDLLLRETQAQLRQSQEVLQKLSTGAFATQAVAGGALPSPVDALASTQASATASRYEVVAPLGQGGMAKVFIAVVRGAEGFKRTFVLKRLKAEHAGNQELVNQFIDEARLGASLVQSNIVPIFDFGRDGEGYYLAQEYILGRNVDALIAASQAKRARPLEVPIVAAIAQEALKALAYAHTRTTDAGQAAGLVHRDVSPSNLMVSGRGEVKLLDFGIVLSADRVTQTQAGVVKGNLFYMSPEQARALPVDPRSDLFSLGMVMVTATLGRPLYTGESMYELMTRAAAGPTEADLALVRAGAGALATFLVKALAVDPALRFQSAKDMAAALASVAPAAPSSELEVLMSALFKEDLDAERQRFAEAS